MTGQFFAMHASELQKQLSAWRSIDQPSSEQGSVAFLVLLHAGNCFRYSGDRKYLQSLEGWDAEQRRRIVQQACRFLQEADRTGSHELLEQITLDVETTRLEEVLLERDDLETVLETAELLIDDPFQDGDPITHALTLAHGVAAELDEVLTSRIDLVVRASRQEISRRREQLAIVPDQGRYWWFHALSEVEQDLQRDVFNVLLSLDGDGETETRRQRDANAAGLREFAAALQDLPQVSADLTFRWEGEYGALTVRAEPDGATRFRLSVVCLANRMLNINWQAHGIILESYGGDSVVPVLFDSRGVAIVDQVPQDKYRFRFAWHAVEFETATHGGDSADDVLEGQYWEDRVYVRVDDERRIAPANAQVQYMLLSGGRVIHHGPMEVTKQADRRLVSRPLPSEPSYAQAASAPDRAFVALVE